jgi:peptidoglycan/LPS O-acetylase OafA/YrhL
MSSKAEAEVAVVDVGVADGSDRSLSVRTFVYNPALDGIRAFAVVAVMLFHGGVLTGGYLGVDAFFVLSGFLITSLILHEIRNEGQLNRSRFWARRARRLLPALFLMLFAVCAYAALFAQQSELDRIRGDALATVFYVANWHAIFSGNGYWELFQAPSPLEHMWSLAIEEQFYVIWPLVVVAIAAIITRRRNQHTNPAPLVFAIAVIAGISSTVWCSVLFRADDVSRAYLGTDTRVGSILFGSAFAAWIVWKGPVRRHTSRIALEILAIAATIMVAGNAWTGCATNVVAMASNRRHDFIFFFVFGQRGKRKEEHDAGHPPPLSFCFLQQTPTQQPKP